MKDSLLFNLLCIGFISLSHTTVHASDAFEKDKFNDDFFEEEFKVPPSLYQLREMTCTFSTIHQLSLRLRQNEEDLNLFSLSLSGGFNHPEFGPLQLPDQIIEPQLGCQFYQTQPRNDRFRIEKADEAWQIFCGGPLRKERVQNVKKETGIQSVLRKTSTSFEVTLQVKHDKKTLKPARVLHYDFSLKLYNGLEPEDQRPPRLLNGLNKKGQSVQLKKIPIEKIMGSIPIDCHFDFNESTETQLFD